MPTSPTYQMDDDSRIAPRSSSPSLFATSIPSIPRSARRNRKAGVVVATALAWLVASLPGEARAVTENYCSFPTSLSTWTLNGNAFEADASLLRLTTGGTLNEASSAFLTTPLNLTATTSLHASFRFTMGTSATGGDGVAFVIQDSTLQAAALGADDGNLGVLGAGKIAPSVVVDFVTDANAGDLINSNRVGLLSVTSAATTLITQATPPFTMSGASMVYAWVDYNAPTKILSVYLNSAATKPATALINSAAVNLSTLIGATAYVGFAASTGATAAKTNEQDIYELELSTDGIPCSCEGDSACSGAPGTPACGSSGLCTICSASNHSACTGATPVCNTASSTCVGCLTNATCSGATPICDATALTCRGCNGNSDCGGTTPYCDNLTGSAALGTCVACVADVDCGGSTPRCDLVTNACTQCLSSTDCGGDSPICTSGTCRACAGDGDCSATPTTPACEVWGACGQCSSTNAARCSGGTGVCDYPTGTCVACEFNTDCAGTTPTCNPTTHTCRPCAHNADCVGNPSGPACVLSGLKVGSCVGCEADTDCTSAGAPRCDTVSNTCVACLSSTDCAAPAPVCSSANLCVGCASSSDCTAAAPTCDTSSSTCKPCQSDYAASAPGPRSCPTPALPACQPTGAPLQGQCGQCSSINNAACATSVTTPVCQTKTATCGCTADADCNADSYCDTSSVASGTCTAGCRVVGGIDNCATGEYCTQTNGTVGACTSEPCNSNDDITSPKPVCQNQGQPQVCVQCINDSDCPTVNGASQVCDAKNHCVPCTTQETKNCSATGAGAACLASETCGCAQDGDCGGPSSERVCDAATSACAVGCRGTGGNGCPAGEVCSSTTSAIGACVAAPVDGGIAGIDAGGGGAGAGDASIGGGEAGGGDASTSSGSGGGTTPSGGGGCKVASSREGGGWGAMGGIALALGLRFRRRRRP